MSVEQQVYISVFIFISCARTGVITICSLLKICIMYWRQSPIYSIFFGLLNDFCRRCTMVDNVVFTSLLSKYCTRSCRDIIVNKTLHYR